MPKKISPVARNVISGIGAASGYFYLYEDLDASYKVHSLTREGVFVSSSEEYEKSNIESSHIGTIYEDDEIEDGSIFKVSEDGQIQILSPSGAETSATIGEGLSDKIIFRDGYFWAFRQMGYELVSGNDYIWTYRIYKINSDLSVDGYDEFTVEDASNAPADLVCVYVANTAQYVIFGILTPDEATKGTEHVISFPAETQLNGHNFTYYKEGVFERRESVGYYRGQEHPNLPDQEITEFWDEGDEPFSNFIGGSTYSLDRNKDKAIMFANSDEDSIEATRIYEVNAESNDYSAVEVNVDSIEGSIIAVVQI